jgi:uncharacterized protein YbjT (DUF2867 family)
MSAVVTGAAGFIGSHLVELLVARGERVVTVYRRPGAPAAAAVWMVADLLGPDPDGSVGDALRGADAVFHLAARPGVRDAGAGGGRAALPRQRLGRRAGAARRPALGPGGGRLLLVGVRRGAARRAAAPQPGE